MVALVLIAGFWYSELTLEYKFTFQRYHLLTRQYSFEPKHTQIVVPLQPLFVWLSYCFISWVNEKLRFFFKQLCPIEMLWFITFPLKALA